MSYRNVIQTIGQIKSWLRQAESVQEKVGIILVVSVFAILFFGVYILPLLPSKPGGGKYQSISETPNYRMDKSVSPQKASFDGRFIADSNGIVRDIETGLEWFAGPDRETTWPEAKAWVESLNVDGGGWRMPTREELKTLYRPGAGTRNMTSLLKTTGWAVWSGETRDSSSAGGFYFHYGNELWGNRSDSNNGRGFAVRSLRQ